MRKLIWKEWHEQSWKLAFGCIVLSAFAVIGLRSRIVADLALVSYVCAIGVLILPITSATGLFPAERAEGSFESLIAMPIQPWKILLAKTISGVVLCAGPLAVAAVFSVWIAGDRETPAEEVLALYEQSALSSVSLLVWMMAFSIRLPNEGRAALLSMGVLVIWGVITWSMFHSEYLRDTHALAFTRWISVTPFGWFFVISYEPPAGYSLAVNALIQGTILVAVWALGLRMLTALAEVRS